MRLLAALAVTLATTFVGAPSFAKGLEPTRISLPKGPGSIEGLGRNFAPSLASGTASYGVDIAVPPSAGGHAPRLSLDYDSGGGVSDLGMGWKLGGLPAVRRRTDEGVPRFEPNDPLEITGFGPPSDLLEVSPGTFRPQYESGAFVRVQRADGGFEARDKAGITYRFGGPGFVVEEAGRVVTWLLRETLDLHGHRIAYAWDLKAGHGALARVVWNDFSPAVRNEIVLRYEGRPDRHVLFSSGIREEIAERLSAIEVTHGGALVRRYELAYAPGVHSRLASVTLVGKDGVSKMPALSLAYTEPSFNAAGQVVTMTTPPGRTPEDPNVELTDLDGDGLPDLLVTQAGAYRSYVNHDGTSWKAGVDWAPGESPSMELGTTGVQLADVDGDGAIDLLVKSGVASLRYLRGSTATAFGPAVPIPTVPNVTFEDPDVKLADMDGDRRADVVVTTAAGLAIGYNVRGVDWTPPSVIGVVDARQPLRFSDGGHTQLCDVNGDRVQDLCFLRSGSLVYWLGRGRGRFEAPRTASGVPSYDESSPWQLRDLDGDGWVDLVHVGVNRVDVALAHAAGEFDAPRTIAGTPAKGPTTTVRFADMNGSGTTDIVWIDVSGSPSQAWRYLELFPDGRAGLLRRIDNGLGKVTSIAYGPAARDAAAARDEGRPWTSRMNVAMPVVRRMETDASLGDPRMAAEYTYRDGTWSPGERTFAGFGGGIERALGDAHTPTLLTESTFDVGLTDRTLRGVVLTQETKDERGTRFARVTSRYTTKTLARALDGRGVEYSFKSASESQHIEGLEPSAARTTLVELEQDDFGNVTAERKWGEVSAGDKLAGNDEAITLRTFANNTQDWLLGRIATEELQDARGARVRMSRTYYDGAPFVGLPLGQIARGDTTRQEEWVGPAPDAFELAVATAYDRDGHPIESRNARGGGHRFTWDNEDHTTLLAESVVLESGLLTERIESDRASGNVLRVVGYGEETTTFDYDPFGRVTTVVRPGASAERPTVRYRYEPGAPLSRIVTERRTWEGRDALEVSEDVFDGLGRKRASVVDLGDGRFVLAGVQALDARGNPWRALRNRFASAADRAAPPLLEGGPGVSSFRDALGRVTRTVTNSGIESRTAYGPLVEKKWDGAQSSAASPYEHTPTVFEKDGLGRLIRHTQTLGGAPLSAVFAYDAAGSLVRKTDPEGHTARYGYDGRGRRVWADDPDGGRHVFVYDATGSLVERRDPTGAVQRFTFDLAGRDLTADWDGDGVPEVVHTWDTSELHPGDPLYRGKLASVRDPSGVTQNEYDARTRLVRSLHTVDGVTYAVGSAYDAQDREYWHQFPDGSSLRIHRDARGFVTGYGDAVRFAYEADGVEVDRTWNTGVVQQHGYDDDRRRNQTRVRTATGGLVQHLAWTYDDAGNILALKDLRQGIEPSRDRSEAYAYDNLYRLTGAKGTWGQSAWRYSPSGNLLERRSTEPSLDAGAMTYGQGAGPHALTGFRGRTLRYDAEGRLLDDGDRTYTWNGADQLTRVASKSGAAVESVFDGSGTRRLRIERSPSGEVKKTVFLDAWSEVKDEKVERYIAHAGRRIAKLAPGNGAVAPSDESGGCSTASSSNGAGIPGILLALFVLLGWRFRRLAARAVPWLALVLVGVAAMSQTACAPEADGPPPILEGSVRLVGEGDSLLFDDHVGSLTEETTATGTVRGSFAAYPFGLTRYDTSAETRKFANAPRDTGVGLDVMGARTYAPDLNVWTSVDPVTIGSPERGIGESFAANNPYGYAGLTPVVAQDEDGHFLHIALGAAIGGTVGLIQGVVSEIDRGGKIDGAAIGRIYMHSNVGAATGAGIAALGPLSVPASIGVGAVAGTAEGIAHRVIDGKGVGTEQEVSRDMLAGGAGGGLGAMLGRASAFVASRVARAAPPVVRQVARQGGGGICFAEGTLVATADGLRPIEQVRAGDRVWSQDESTGELALRSVARTFVTEGARLLELRVLREDGTADTLRTTPEHPFWTLDGGWRRAADLGAGTRLVSPAGAVQVLDVAPVPGEHTVYNFEVEGFHTYFVGEVAAWVHNECDAVTRRPGSFRKATVRNAWDSAAPGPTGGKVCPTCGKEVQVPPGKGTAKAPRDWDVDHQPPWATRDLTGKTRQEVLDDYNTGTRLECPSCNRSRGAKPAQ